MIGLTSPSGGNEADSKTPIRPCRRSIGCIRQNGSEKTAFQTVSSNISAGGIAVVMPEHISAEPGEKLYVSFSLPGKENTADITAEAVTQRIFYDEKADKQK